ncbi:MAG: diacylglycerol/lipid kinase family protein [Streptosporangiaceae bacterium]
MVRRRGGNLCIPEPAGQGPAGTPDVLAFDVSEEPHVDSPLSLIVNPTAGGGRARTLMPAVSGALRGAGVEHRIAESASLVHARDLAADAAARGEAIVAVGGDGMAGALSGVAAANGVSFGLIPAGRGNDLATVLGIPADPLAAARVLATGHHRQIDLLAASASGHPEVLVAGSVYAGIPAVAGEIANATRWLRGGMVYTVAALRALARWQPAQFTVEGTDDGAHEFDGYAIVVANSALFGAGMRVAPTAQIDDGVLDLVLMRHAPKLTFVRALQKIKDGSHVALPEISLQRGADVTITMSRDLPAAADGESLACACPLPAGTPLRVRAMPAALTVFVPAV